MAGGRSIFSDDTAYREVTATYAECLGKDLPDELIQAWNYDTRELMVRKLLVDCPGTPRPPKAGYTQDRVRGGLDRREFYGSLFCFRNIKNPHEKIHGGEFAGRHIEKDSMAQPQHFGWSAGQGSGALWTEITSTVMDHGLRLAGKMPEFRPSFNFSERAMGRGQYFVDALLRKAAKHGASPSQIDLEILDWTSSLKPYVDMLQKLREEGVNLALDDYPRGETKRLLEEADDIDVDIRAIKFDGPFTASLLSDTKQVRDAMDTAMQLGIREFCFEGFDGYLIVERTLDKIRAIQEQLPETTLLTEGPVYPE